MMRSPRMLLGLLLAAAASPAAAQPAPVLLEVFPPGGEPGGQVRVTLSGKRLETVTGLWFDHPGLHATLHQPPPEPEPEGKAPADGKKRKDRKGEGKSAPKVPANLVWDVTIDPGVPGGLHDLRAVTSHGVSAPRAFHISTLPLRAGLDPVEGKAVELELESRVAGWVEAGIIERFRLRAPRKARVVVECLGERIDSRLDATLEVRDGAGRRVAYSQDLISLDPALAFDAEEGGEYAIDLWDFTYGGKHPYLLSVSTGPRALFAFPPALSATAETEVVFHGWNLGGAALAPLPALETRTAKLPPAVPAPAGPSASRRTAYRRTTYRRTGGLLGDVVEATPPGLECEPLVLALAREPMALEREPDGTPGEAAPLEVPSEVHGRFDVPADRDWYSFRAAKGQVLEIEVESARLDAPCDPVLLIGRREARKEGQEGKAADRDRVRDLLYLDERKTGFPRDDSFRRKFVASERDPSAIWTAPEDGEYLLMVRNRNGRHGPGAFYRLVVRTPRPDFSLVVIHSENQAGEAATVPRGGSQCYDVLVERRGGHSDVVKVFAEGLPPGLSCSPVYLGPGESFVPLVFAATAEMEPWTGRVEVVGEAEAGMEPGRGPEGKPRVLRRSASSAVMVYGGSEVRHPLEYVHSRLAGSLLLAVRDTAPFAVLLEPAERTAPPGAKVSFQARISRREGFAEGVALSYQGLSERSSQDGDGSRPAKATVGKDKAEQEVTLTVKADAGYGERTFVVYATAPVEYAEDPRDPKSKKEKRRTTLVSNPVTIRLVPPVALELGVELGVADVAAPTGGAARIPFRLKRAEGVAEEVEVALEMPSGAKGFTSEPVKVPKGTEAGEVLVAAGPSAAAPLEGAALRTRVQFAGRRFEERIPLPFALRRVDAFRVTAVESARVGLLRLGLARAPSAGRKLPEARVAVEVSLASGGEARAEALLREGEAEGAAVLESQDLFGQNARPDIFPLKVRLRWPASSGGGGKGEAIEEHIVNPMPVPPVPVAPERRAERSY